MVWLPVPHILKVAWDATKLGVALKGYKRERALVEAKKNQVIAYKRKAATRQLKKLFDEEKYEEFARLYIPDLVMDKLHDLKDLWWSIWDIYWLFILLRIFIILNPYNSGYIHPDEYFQSVEVTVGDVFNIDVHRTWEFNTTQPLRSPTVSYSLYGIPLTILRVINTCLYHYLGINIVGPLLVDLLPRVVLLVLSFSVDFMVYQICVLYKHNFNQCLTTLASSYIMIIYSTRSFSNTIELVFTSVLVYLVAHCLRRTDETIYLHELVQDKYDKAETIRDRVEINKKRKKIPPHDYKYLIPIGVLCGVGIFNRPTFVFYAFAPLFFWLQRGVSNHSVFSPFQTFNFRVVLLVPVIVATFLVMIFCDSLYYGDLTWRKLWNLNMNYTDWKVAPFNFIMYNAVPGNIASHGEHPRYTHVLVNLPMLLGPLAPVFLVTILNWILDACYLPWKKKPSLRNVYALSLFTTVVPLIALSAVKHQEARFLIPVLPCIVLLCAHKLRWKAYGYKPLLTLWYIFNIIAMVWFGFVHQAGVMPVQKFIGRQQHDDVPYINLIYSHTYMPPRYPLFQPANLKLEEFPGYISNKRTKYMIQDLGSVATHILQDKLTDIVSRTEYISSKKKVKMETYLIIPEFLLDQLKAEAAGAFSFQPLYSSFPHVSVESLDKLELEFHDAFGHLSLDSVLTGVANMLAGFGLSVVNVTTGQAVQSVNIPSSNNM